jgi:hypothetical protein
VKLKNKSKIKSSRRRRWKPPRSRRKLRINKTKGKSDLYWGRKWRLRDSTSRKWKDRSRKRRRTRKGRMKRESSERSRQELKTRRNSSENKKSSWSRSLSSGGRTSNRQRGLSKRWRSWRGSSRRRLRTIWLTSWRTTKINKGMSRLSGKIFRLSTTIPNYRLSFKSMRSRWGRCSSITLSLIRKTWPVKAGKGYRLMSSPSLGTRPRLPQRWYRQRTWSWSSELLFEKGPQPWLRKRWTSLVLVWILLA